ncbi:MAG: thioredoxin domain-containing protein [Kofleriaceae bacterium]|nr:thioredoxin domain-containing protein [Kofleriaceae bacterium]
MRQALGRVLGRRWRRTAAAIGAVLPTGPYVPRSGAANLAPEASYLTLGRGAPWALLDLDTRARIGSRWSAITQVALRYPLARTSDGFQWGTEARLTLGGAFAAHPRLSVMAMTDVQWRAGATEPDPFSMMRLISANAGGWQWTFAPSVSASIARGLSVIGGLRIPLLAHVTGNQLVPQIGAFVALSYDLRGAPARSRPPIAAAPGQITVVDYWATWCTPCGEISRRLEEAAPRWPDVRVVKVDATNWPGDGAPELPPGARGLPVVEILDPAGVRIELLVGEAALGVVEKVDALRARVQVP